MQLSTTENIKANQCHRYSVILNLNKFKRNFRFIDYWLLSVRKKGNFNLSVQTLCSIFKIAALFNGNLHRTLSLTLPQTARRTFILVFTGMLFKLECQYICYVVTLNLKRFNKFLVCSYLSRKS